MAMGCGDTSKNFMLSVTATNDTCAVGEKVGRENAKNERIPVLSCEGACIKGEIARVAANILAKNGKYGRCCHGELFTVPDSQFAAWAKEAPKIVCIDGCYLKCHSRILENLIESSRLISFDALSHYKKYADLFDIDSVSEDERKAVAQEVADWVKKSIDENTLPDKKADTGCCCV